jgi:hypothetical protein
MSDQLRSLMKMATKNQINILQHSLGVDQYGQGEQYRNYFATGPDSSDFNDCTQLVALGLMKTQGPMKINNELHCFCVTPAGIDYVAFNSDKPPKLTKSQQRYKAYLKSGSEEGFFDFLVNPYWDDYRKEMGC